MKITIKGTNIELSDSVYQYVYDKIGGLEKFVQDIGPKTGDGNPPIECWVEVERTSKHHQSGDVFRTEVQIKLPQAAGIRAESRQRDLHQAIDEVKDELQRQLKRYKEKMIAKRKTS